MSDAEIEALRQADAVFDWETHCAIIEGTYNGPMPERVAFDMWSDIYPDIYHTTIAGINFRRGIKDLSGSYFKCHIEADPKNKYDHNAIKIISDDGRHLGFIPADETEDVRAFINYQLPYSACRAHIDEGEEYDEESERDRTYLYGVINITRPDQPNVSPLNIPNVN